MSPKDKKMTLSMNTGSKHVQIQKDKENGDRWRSVAAGGVSRSICKHCRLHRCTGSDGNKRQGVTFFLPQALRNAWTVQEKEGEMQTCGVNFLNGMCLYRQDVWQWSGARNRVLSSTTVAVAAAVRLFQKASHPLSRSGDRAA